MSAHIVQSAHILLIQFWEIARPQKKLSLFCHSVSQVTFTANNLTAGEKKGRQQEVVFPHFGTETQLEDFKRLSITR